jgi:Tfp pilus assembly protein PilN
MPAEQITVNLLEHDSFEDSPIGRLVTWATTYGRYIMILTEIVVLLAFISRFALDRKRADLDEDIASKQAIIEANIPFENQVRDLQLQLSQIKTIISDQSKPLDTLLLMKSILPEDVYFQTYDYGTNTLNIKAVAGSTNGFMIFMNNLQAIKQFSRVEVGEIKKDPASGITFQFNVFLVEEKQQAKIENAEPEKL